jgi:hypothetical protein
MPTLTVSRTAARRATTLRLAVPASLSATRSAIAPAIEAALGTPASGLSVERLGAAPLP